VARKVVIESLTLSSPRRKRTVIETSDEDEQFYRGVREILAELPQSEDITILTLKGHLIIEQLLIQIMENAALNPAPLKDLNRLQFSTRVAFVESLSPISGRGDGGIWPLIRKIGKIRNDIAHQLKPKKLDQDVQTFLDLYIHYFGAQIVPPVHPVNRDKVTKDNYLIPQNVRTGTTAQKYRNALAGTTQGLVGALSVIRDYAKLARVAVQKERDRMSGKKKPKATIDAL
jgi:hypothetical protein